MLSSTICTCDNFLKKKSKLFTTTNSDSTNTPVLMIKSGGNMKSKVSSKEIR